MTRTQRRRPPAVITAILLLYVCALAAPAPAAAMQILDAADHAELVAEISATGLNRIALAGDRIARVVRSPDGFAAEHDAASGDLYLRPSDGPISWNGAPETSGEAPGHVPVTLFVGTEKGFTYRLTLTPSDRDSAQILIRNAAALPGAAPGAPAPPSDPHVAALVLVVRAVARRAPLPGYAIHGGSGPSSAGLTVIETWRGPRLSALVFEAGPSASGGADGAAGLAGTIGALPGAGRVAALWLAAPGTGPSGGRLAVAVVEPDAAPDAGGEPR